MIYKMSYKQPSYGTIFKYLLYTDLLILKEVVVDKMINLAIWATATTAVMGHIMAAFGLANFGPFQLAGVVASAGLFEVFPSVMNLANDFAGDRTIDYQLTLPIPAWLVLLKIICYNAINSMILTIMVIPIGKLVLWNQFDLTGISIFKIICMIVVLSIFYATLTLWLAGKVTNLAKIGNVWMRFIFPFWFLGGFQFSWDALHKVFPTLAYFNLFNPMTYAMEGSRAALLGQNGYFNFWLCICALLVVTMLCFYNSYHALKRHLDFVG